VGNSTTSRVKPLKGSNYVDDPSAPSKYGSNGSANRTFS